MNSHIYTEKCATCEYWIGERKLIINGNGNSVVKSIDNTAGCRNKKSKFYGAEKKDKHKCIEYKRWSKISDE